LYTYEHPRAAHTVDIVLIRKSPGSHQVLLIRRKNDPFMGKYALPGGFVDQSETTKSAAIRELKEETGIINIDLFQIHTFSDPGRDPRGWVISTAYGAILEKEKVLFTRAGSDASHIAWFDLNKLPSLAFDHHLIIETALIKLDQS
jgi:8-oxo-dGTP diphosphatase